MTTEAPLLDRNRSVFNDLMNKVFKPTLDAAVKKLRWRGELHPFFEIPSAWDLFESGRDDMAFSGDLQVCSRDKTTAIDCKITGHVLIETNTNDEDIEMYGLYNVSCTITKTENISVKMGKHEWVETNDSTANLEILIQDLIADATLEQ